MAVRLAVFLIAVVLLGYNVGGVGLAETWIDPIAHIPAQDEAVYSSTALHMAHQGGWLTPMFLGRYAFYKPPLLYWLAGLSDKLFGAPLWSLRLPSLLAGAAVATILFEWLRQAYSVWAGLAGGVLLISDRLFHVLSRLVLSDMLVVLCIVVAMACLHWNPGLTETRWLWIFGVAVGAAIMTKSLAGLLPLIMLAAAGVGWRRFVEACGIAALVAAPWHAYQLAVHPKWFWAEYVLTENFAWAVAAPAQSTQENQLLYYLKRLVLTDPIVCVAAVAGLPALVRERNRLLAAWVGVVFLALAGFGYRNTSYLLLLIPALCLAAGPVVRYRGGAAVLGVIAIVRLFWLPYHAEHPIPAAAELRRYAALHRKNDLTIVGLGDEFVATTLPIRHVRYCFYDPNPDGPRLPLDFRYLGITLTAEEFSDLPRLEPVYAKRLTEFGLRSTAPIGTVVTFRSQSEIDGLIRAHPEIDFYWPDKAKWLMGPAP